MAKSRDASPSAGGGSSQDDAVISEQTPLLAGVNPPAAPAGATEPQQPNENGVGNGEAVDGQDDKPLPIRQILILSYVRVVEPIAFFSIFPYVNQMVKQNGGLADEDVGFYSGLIESLFSLTQAVVMIFWGRLSDRVGRKPVLISSLIGVSFATGLFGLAKTIPQMIMFRCLAGVFAGTIVTIRTMIAEHSTPKTQARAFTYFAFSGNLGIFFGPLLGGALADPAGQYGGPFERIPLFVEYPYFLSSFVVALIGLTAVFLAFFAEETLVKKPKHDTVPTVGTAPAATTAPAGDTVSAVGRIASAAIAEDEDDNSIRGLLESPGAGFVIYVFLYVAILAFAYTAIVPVFWFTPIAIGGYGMTPVQISIFMGITGAAQALWMLIVFPPLHRRVGTNGVMRLCGTAWPFLFIICPAGNAILRLETHDAETAFWVLLPPLLCLGVGVSMAFTAVQLATNDVSPSPRVLGTLNAVALTGSSITRAFCPALFTSLFAIGANTQWLWGYAIWVVMVVITAGFAVSVRYLPDYEELKLKRQEAERERERAAAGGWINHDVTDG